MQIGSITEYHMTLDFDEITDAAGLQKHCDEHGYDLDDSGICITIEAFDSEEKAKDFLKEMNRFLAQGGTQRF